MVKGDMNCSKILLCFFIILTTGLSKIQYSYAEKSPNNIIILNSYHKGLSWTDEQTEGIIHSLKDCHADLSISVEYMDWKRYPTQENMNHIYNQLKYKYSGQKIDLVLTTDDTALDFALKNRHAIFSDAPVVFCGVNEKDNIELLKKYKNVTGVLENPSPDKTIQVALEMNPAIKEIYLIYDHTKTGLSLGELAMEAIHRIKPEIKVMTYSDKPFSKILDDVAHAPKDSIVLITTYYSDMDHTVSGFEKTCKLISETSTVPVYHVYTFGLNNGAIGGSMFSGMLHGEAAGRIACRVLEGENIDAIPLSNDETTTYIFDYNQLQRFNIPKDKLPEGSKIINRPESFFETYRHIVINTVHLIVVLISLIVILLLHIKKIHKMKKELEIKHYELTELNEELAASDLKLKRQYLELVKTQENLMHSEYQYRLLFEKMLNGFFVFEPVFNEDHKLVDIRFLNANPSFKKQVKMKVNDVIGKTWTEAFGYPSLELSIYERILETGRSERFETYYGKENAYFLVNAFKISDQQIGVIFDNISDYKKAIKEIKKFNEELEERVAIRTAELSQAIDELESFTYTVSHDLKSPLRAIDSYSRIMYEDHGESLHSDVIDIIHNIRGICKDLINMINNLLEYSMASKKELNKEEIDIKEMFLSVFNELQLAYPERNVALTIETVLPKVYADKLLLRQVIYNILSNAFKFTKNTDKPRIIIGNTITSEEYIFYVKDNGIGFNMEYSKKLFGIFQRLHTSDEFEGTGIGLVTIKKIIQKHGGRAWIEGQVNVGATIYFTLPFSW
ncbi:MAG: hypothetical protein PWP07_502 [Epulopiscium sp.]|nr:hypothetical protein [Candidatus Epulonipiscium sp.]